jgi:N-acetylated-alpha-linked acidic dipeptidase
MRTLLLCIGLLSSLAAPRAVAQDPAPPSRGLLLELTRQARLAGTTGSHWGARFVARELEKAGWEVEIDAREVLLSLPRRIVVEGYDADATTAPLFKRTERFDPDASPPGDVPPFNAWSASGRLFAQVVDAGYGLRKDFDRLRELGIPLKGKIALARYGRCYRGVKAQLAEEYGCSGILLFNDPKDSGAERGATWPEGPWKPDWSVERGSISPMAKAPGDASTPGWASNAPGAEGHRLSPAEYDASLPKILCTPIPYREAKQLIDRLAPMIVTAKDGTLSSEALGPGPVQVQLGIWQPRELRTIYNVIGTLKGKGDDWVLAGNHRDAWVRGANDAGGGTVALLRAAQRLGERARLGWQPDNTLKLCFWDAEETGLVGSTEWGEAHKKELQEHCLVYINGDAVVGGTKFRGASGTPGLLDSFRSGLEKVQQVGGGGNLWDAWVEATGNKPPKLGLPGAGSDYTVFLHHLNLPIIDLTLGGSSAGQYHTSFDNFAQVDRFIDPTWEGHELAGELFATLMTEFASLGRASFSEAQAARRMADVSRNSVNWLGAERAQRLGDAFDSLATRMPPEGSERSQDFYRRVSAEAGLPRRKWYRNRLWAPGLETGYASETFPTLRFSALISDEALDHELNSLIRAIAASADSN